MIVNRSLSMTNICRRDWNGAVTACGIWHMAVHGYDNVVWCGLMLVLMIRMHGEQGVSTICISSQGSVCVWLSLVCMRRLNTNRNLYLYLWVGYVYVCMCIYEYMILMCMVVTRWMSMTHVCCWYRDGDGDGDGDGVWYWCWLHVVMGIGYMACGCAWL